MINRVFSKQKHCFSFKMAKKPGFILKNRVYHEKQGLSEQNRVYQSKTGFIREKQGLSEKKGFIMKNRVYQRKTGFLSVVDD